MRSGATRGLRPTRTTRAAAILGAAGGCPAAIVCLLTCNASLCSDARASMAWRLLTGNLVMVQTSEVFFGLLLIYQVRGCRALASQQRPGALALTLGCRATVSVP